MNQVPDGADQLRELVRRMGKARDRKTPVYMPAALLAVGDLAEQGKVRNGIVQVADYVAAFKRLMLDVWPTREDRWFRPMLHCKQHRMWQPILDGREVAYDSRRTSSLSESRARAVADSLRLDPLVQAAMDDPRSRTELRQLVYALLRDDKDERSTRLAALHEHLDPAQTETESLRMLADYEHRHDDRDAFEDLRVRRHGEHIVRPGQQEFRRMLLVAYDRRCCMSAADAPWALQAAHIFPHKGRHSDRVTNGLLLRGDLHTLFDDGLITIVVDADFVIDLHRELKRTVYSELEGRPLRLPKQAEHRPDREALDWHHRKNRP